MKNQIFKTLIEPEIVWGFIKEHGEECEDTYLFSKVQYKKAIFHGAITDFIDKVRDCYHESKKYYITRKMDYSKFITVLRQVCNINNISYSKKMLYNNSTYEIVYYIDKPAAPAPAPALVPASITE